MHGTGKVHTVNTQHGTLVPKQAASGPAEEEAVCSPLGTGQVWVSPYGPGSIQRSLYIKDKLLVSAHLGSPLPLNYNG